MVETIADAAPALKEIFNMERIHHIADEACLVYPAFDRQSFLQAAATWIRSR